MADTVAMLKQSISVTYQDYVKNSWYCDQLYKQMRMKAEIAPSYPSFLMYPINLSIQSLLVIFHMHIIINRQVNK